MKQVSDLLLNVVPEELKEEINLRFVQNEDLLIYLSALLEKRIKNNSTSRLSKSQFGNPAWPYMQAHCNGYEDAMTEIITLLKLRNTSDND